MKRVHIILMINLLLAASTEFVIVMPSAAEPIFLNKQNKIRTKKYTPSLASIPEVNNEAAIHVSHHKTTMHTPSTKQQAIIAHETDITVATHKQTQKNKAAITASLTKIQQKNATLSEQQATQQLLENYTAIAKKANPQVKAMIEPRIDILNQRITKQNKPQEIISKKIINLAMPREQNIAAQENVMQLNDKAQTLTKKDSKFIASSKALLTPKNNPDGSITYIKPYEPTSFINVKNNKVVASADPKSSNNIMNKNGNIITPQDQKLISHKDVYITHNSDGSKTYKNPSSQDFVTVDTQNNIVSSSDQNSAKNPVTGVIANKDIMIQQDKKLVARASNLTHNQDGVQTYESQFRNENQGLSTVTVKNNEIISSNDPQSQLNKKSIKSKSPKIEAYDPIADRSIFDMVFDTNKKETKTAFETPQQGTAQGALSILGAMKKFARNPTTENVTMVFTSIRTSINNLFAGKQKTAATEKIQRDIDKVQDKFDHASAANKSNPNFMQSLQTKIMQIYNDAISLAFGAKKNQTNVIYTTESTPDQIRL